MAVGGEYRGVDEYGHDISSFGIPKDKEEPHLVPKSGIKPQRWGGLKGRG